MRLDVWLWAARFFKSRSLATAACRAGKVRINDVIAKASSQVDVGDAVTWRDPLRNRDVLVVDLLQRRVGAPEAAKAYVDRSPALPTKEERGAVPMRDRGAGRPEKKDRRDLDELRGFHK
ncbi:MAG: RNA-binding S4 domain-containing protein [Propionibacteriaceae bacterium]|nr:RNA-binding S4 domain-containing protein [Propionibacteriaceae bacterium]